MAPVDSEGGARDAGEVRQDDAPEPLQGREEAGEQEEEDYAAEEEQGDGEEAPTHEEGARDEGEAGQDDASEPLQGREEAGEQEEEDYAAEEEQGDGEEAPTHEEGARDEGEAGQDDASEPLQGREEAGEQDEDGDAEEEEGDEEEDPTHLPFAPSSESELLDDTTTVDPSYTISLIRKLLPQGSNVEKEFSAKQGFPEERNANSDNEESTQPEIKDPWEECGCILWDLAASKPQAELMMNNLVLEVLLANLRVTQSHRVKEICLGIMGNLACHESLVNAISLQNGLIATVVEQLFLDDSACLSETFRLLSAILRSSAFISWAEALLPDEILSRIIWIIGNTLNSTLLEKSIDFLSTVIDDQKVTAMLIEPLIKVGLVDHAISLLTTEIEKLSDESKLDRPGSLGFILHFFEELSALDSCSEVMSSSDQLIKVLNSMVKLPDKFEVANCCASVVIILANLLADGKHLVPMLSRDLPLLEGLFDILPLVSDDNEARNALWCILSRFLAQAQEIDMNSSSLDQFAALFLGRFTLIKDDLESHGVGKEENLSAEDAYLKHGLSTSLRAICVIMERWIAEKSSHGTEDTPLTGNSIENARKLLSYCRKFEL